MKGSDPVLIFVGRLVRSKLPEHAILAFEHVKSVLPKARLWIVGDGYLKPKLQRKVGDGVTFFGRVPEGVKFELLRRAHVLLAPSVREGWGISIIEANAMGTPAVGYSVPGLRDSIIDGVTGILVPPKDALAMGIAAERILRSPSLAEKLSRNSLERSKEFTWDEAANEFHQLLRSVVNRT
jgi:glycosyltransferase involved in cell wall biosynthesis